MLLLMTSDDIEYCSMTSEIKKVSDIYVFGISNTILVDEANSEQDPNI